ncbi:MAG: 50S ribosomal protein L6 [Simkaniaceae bacterium]|nr:50S ribosomal protein L6 [Simkaniaceae bacterium]MCF7851880.1 50S ribosomal protein L6 [Simkaniaceae bacterium]
MSRLAKKPLPFPKGAELSYNNRIATAKGPKGALTLDIPEGIELEIKDEAVMIEVNEKKFDKSFLGLYRALINNLLIGVSQGFQKKLTLIGVGFRAALKGDALDLQLGFSHPLSLKIPSGLKVAVDKSTSILIEGCDKQLVGQFAADVRSKRPPEPYKGKGVRYENEYVRKKAGKSAKSK